jgi:hypothetical protein
MSFPRDITVMYLLKGTIPTNFSTLTNINSRISDVLVVWQTSTSVDNFRAGGSSLLTNPMIISSVYKAATVSGTAEWFWLLSNPAYAETETPSATPYQQMFGTVGTIGSGADLEIASTDIITGKSYAVTNLR